MKENNSFLFSVGFSFFSYATSPFYMISDWQKRVGAESSKSAPSVKRTFLIVLPILIALLFLFLYRASNPIFNDFIQKINIDFISFQLLFFTIGGLILLYGFYYHRRIKAISLIDENSQQTIFLDQIKQGSFFGVKLSNDDELFSAKLLFVLLNCIILIVNLLDFDFLFISHHLPDGVTYSQFVHQSTGALIVSILISIIIIIFYFRGQINFSADNKFIKVLAYLWIVQNIVILFSTAMRNGMYIDEYGLTYKRIGVYIYLILTIIGLITTYIKIAKLKTSSYLVRINSWLFYFVLVISCFIDWDNLITDHNIKQNGKDSRDYLIELSEANLPVLFKLQNDANKFLKSDQQISDQKHEEYYERRLSTKLFNFISNDHKASWRSWNYERMRIKNELMEMNQHSELSTLRLTNMASYSLNPLDGSWNIKKLDVSSNYIESISEIVIFSNLVELNISNNRLKQLNGIENLRQLKYLDLSGNFINDFSPLLKLNNLKAVRLPDDISNFQLETLIRHFPELIIVKNL